ncbi:MAG: mechanosensitive ion channel family protein [Oscillospiraceae bacterium]|nr:mechanosensitive ion channel family protein [Oscillospiraceae bacterium]
MDAILEFVKKFPVGKAISIALLVVGCLIAIKLILALFDRVVKKSKMDMIIYKILRVAVKALLMFIAVIIVLGSLGVAVSSLVAALSVVGVAFSLAIQGFLSNVFGGIQIISNKPFQIGDFVDAGGESGTVREVGLFYTKLDTPDKKLVQIPNSAIANANIVNYSSEANRRVDFSISASYDDDTEKVKEVLLELLQNHPLVYKKEDLMPVVHVSAYGANDITYTARAWCANGDYWTVYFDIMDAVKPTFDQKGIAMSYPHVNVHMVKE